jgi:hypothetical protein
MALFNRRKQNTDVLPEEVREYYQSERRERAGVAWLLAVGTLLLTFVIAAGLFFGGRWVYHVVFDNKDDNKQTASQDNGLRVDEKGNVTGGNSQPATTGNNGTSSTNTTTPSTPAPSTGTAATPSTTPNTGDATPVQLIDTGPGDEDNL